tara:strand:- start:3833 stop:4123 length:291 start_codon:yes stop_codon:yes gene_type:complete
MNQKQNFKIGMHQPVTSEKSADDIVIQKKVLEGLGRPKGLKSVKVKNVFGNKWRINIYVEKQTDLCDIPVSVISDSFFCEFKNNKLTCDPKLEKKY